MHKYYEWFSSDVEGFHAARLRLEELRRDPDVINAWMWVNEPYEYEELDEELNEMITKVINKIAIIYYLRKEILEDD